MAQKIKEQDKKSLYKLVIPVNVELKIRRLLEKYNNTEWSGVLFYDYEGTLNEGIVITCKDILLMDKGSAVYTEFEMNEEVLPYMIENELLDCKTGLCHSHHSLKTFFSGTDISTLEERGDLQNNFVSLIVNNNGEYNAAITWKVRYLVRGKAYLFDTEELVDEIEEINELRYSFMTIEREIDKEFIEFDKRIAEVSKLTPSKTTNNIPVYNNGYPSYQSPVVVKDKKEPQVKEPELPLDYELAGEEPNIITLDTKVVNMAAAQLISMNLLSKSLPPEKSMKVTLESLEKRFKKRFDNDDASEVCIENFVTCVLGDLAEVAAVDVKSEELNVYDVEESLALSVIDILSKYSDTSYISNIIDTINSSYGTCCGQLS